ncbi:MAG: hypothetical protein LBG17_03995 [Bacteroidales bacterium]|jgi:hypothetical protein|nr:hypothetical protein [Bacteroidales bacterium]
MKKIIYFTGLIIISIALLHSCIKENGGNDDRLPGTAKEIYVNRDNFNVGLPDTLEFFTNSIEKADDGEYKWIVEGGEIIGTSNDTTIKVAVFDTHKFGDSLFVKVRGANQYGYGAYFETSVIAKGMGGDYALLVEEQSDGDYFTVYFDVLDMDDYTMPSNVTDLKWIINDNTTNYEIVQSYAHKELGYIDLQQSMNSRKIESVHAVVEAEGAVCKSKFSINIK